MKKSYLLILMLFLLSCSTFAYNFEVDGIYYDRNTSTNTVTVTYKSRDYNSYGGTIHIPEEVVYDGVTYCVTEIGWYAFYGCSSLTEVTIGNSVTEIGSYAFYGCSSLTEITIGNSVTEIGSSAFEGCSSLTEVTIGNNVTEIGFRAFYKCSSLSKVTISDGSDVLNFGTSMYYTPFDDCPIEILYIGRNIYYGDYSPFRHITLKSLTIGNSVTEIGNSAFYGCSGYKIVSYAETPPTLYETLDATSVEVPFQTACLYAQSDYWKDIDSIYSVKDGIKYCPILISQEGEALVTVNGTQGNASIEVAESSTVEIKPIGTIETCHLILHGSKNVTDKIKNNGAYTFKPSSCYRKNTVKTMAYSQTVVAVSNSGTLLDAIGIENIDSVYFLKVSGDLNGTDILAIRKMTNLRLLDMEDANIVNGGLSYYQNYVTSENEIGAYFFQGEIVRIILPKSVTSIGQNAFRDCTSLTSVTIDSNVTEIGFSAFENCIGLTSVIIPNSIAKIGSNAFAGCSSLTEVHISDLAAWCNISFEDNPLSYAHHLYLDDEEIKNLIIPNNVTEIRNNTFSGCSGLTSVTIGNNVKKIGGMAFSDCSGLTSVIIGNNVTSIGSDAFNGCSSLTSITIPESVTDIGSGAFRYCSSLTSITIPEGVTYVGNKAFAYCSRLTEITISDGLEELSLSCSIIGPFDTPFDGCPIERLYLGRNTNLNLVHPPFRHITLKSLIIGNCVTEIGGYAFQGCDSLTEVSIGNSVTSIGYCAFKGCSALTEIIVPNSVTEIASYAFEGCSGLTSVTIGNSVTEIGYCAFKGCSNLIEVFIGNNVKSIGQEVFSGCSSITSVTSLNPIPPAIETSTFDETTEKNATLYVPEGCKTVYWLNPHWENFAKIEEIEICEDISEKQAEAMVIYDEGVALYNKFVSFDSNVRTADNTLTDLSYYNIKIGHEIDWEISKLSEKIEVSNLDTESMVYFLNVLDSVDNQKYWYVKWSLGINHYILITDLKKAKPEFTSYSERLEGYKSSIKSAKKLSEIETIIEQMNNDYFDMKSKYYSSWEFYYDSMLQDIEICKEYGAELLKLLQKLKDLEIELDNITNGLDAIMATDGNVIVYTLRGERLVIQSSQIKMLPKGIYIVKGKKYVVK